MLSLPSQLRGRRAPGVTVISICLPPRIIVRVADCPTTPWSGKVGYQVIGTLYRLTVEAIIHSANGNLRTIISKVK